MKSIKVVLSGAALFSLLVLPAANAQATRTWVSGVGDDANPCSRTAPCKTFAGAISKTAAGGEISVLDPGGFGAVTITKSITINGDGTLAGILSAGTNGVIVNAGVNDTVVIRNISINGVGTGLNGIRFLAGKELVVENCWITGVTTHGIDMVVTSSTPRLNVINTTFTNIGQVAVRMSATGQTPALVLDRVRIQKASLGVDILNGVGAINETTISQVTNQAIVAENTSTINVNGGMVTNSGTGVSAFSNGSTVRIANLAILNNTTGISIAAGGTVASFGGNKNAGNTTPGAPNANIVLQ